MPLWRMKLHADSVPCLSNRIITAAAARIVVAVVITACYNNISPSPKARRKFAALCTQLHAADRHRCHHDWSSDVYNVWPT